MQERKLSVRGREIYVRETGQGEPVLLLHGGGPGTSSEGWRRVQELLGERRHVYAPDFPGFGRSAPMPPPGGDPAAYAELILAALEGLGPVAVVGHSMGAQVAARVALARPDLVTHLVLIAPGGRFFGVPGVQPGVAAIGEFLAEPTEARMRIVVALLNGRQDDLEQEVRHRMDLVTSGGRLEQLRAMMGRRAGGGGPPDAQEQVLAQLKRLPMPVMLVWGAEERFTPAEHAALILAALPDGTRFVEIASAGHTVQHDAPEQLAATIAGFLDQTQTRGDADR